MQDPKDLLNYYKCTRCSHVQEHPSFLRNIPACNKCGSLDMTRQPKKEQ